MLSSEGADPHEVEASELTEMSGHDTTWEDMPDFPCLVASSVLKKYNQLSARGKPLTGTEWTPLAAILQYDGTSCVPKVVAMGTGSKCIGESKMSKEGWIVNDSHAEVLARRAFVRWGCCHFP